MSILDLMSKLTTMEHGDVLMLPKEEFLKYLSSDQEWQLKDWCWDRDIGISFDVFREIYTFTKAQMIFKPYVHITER